MPPISGAWISGAWARRRRLLRGIGALVACSGNPGAAGTLPRARGHKHRAPVPGAWRALGTMRGRGNPRRLPDFPDFRYFRSPEGADRIQRGFNTDISGYNESNLRRLENRGRRRRAQLADLLFPPCVFRFISIVGATGAPKRQKSRRERRPFQVFGFPDDGNNTRQANRD